MAEPVFPVSDEFPFAETIDAPSAEGEAPRIVAAPAPPTEAERLQGALAESELVELCREFKNEAMSARETGDQSRDDVWQANLDMYRMRRLEQGKLDWQHNEVSSRGKKAVDRFAAALKRALIHPGQFYAIDDPSGMEDDVFPIIRKIVDAQLGTCATTMNGHAAPFPHVFSRSMKIGALMMACASATWDTLRNRARVDVVDPREYYVDPTGRGLYRFRQREVDYYDALSMPFVFRERVSGLGEWRNSKREQERNAATGHTEGTPPNRRKVVLLDEFLFDCLLDRDGNVIGRNVLVVMANDQRIIRGPEPNPNWHGSDWIVAHPLIDSPLSVYGGTYGEDFNSLLHTLDELTNLMLDGIQVQTLSNFALRPDWLQDPTQANEGMRPFKLWFMGDNAIAGQQFIEKIELGRLGREAVEVWQGIGTEFREASSQNEIGLGQLAPKGQVTATEIQAVGESQGELIQDIAEGIDAGFISPLVRLVWYTTLQNIDPTQPEARRALGDDIAAMLVARREEIRDRSFGFRATAITGLATRAAKARNIMALLQVLGQNPMLAQQFLATHSLRKVLDVLWQTFGMDSHEYRIGPDDPPPPPPQMPPGAGASAPSGGPPATPAGATGDANA